MIAYEIANVLIHSPKRIVFVPQFELLTCVAVVPVGHPYCGFVMVPSDRFRFDAEVVVSAYTKLLKKKQIQQSTPTDSFFNSPAVVILTFLL